MRQNSGETEYTIRLRNDLASHRKYKSQQYGLILLRTNANEYSEE